MNKKILYSAILIILSSFYVTGQQKKIDYFNYYINTSKAELNLLDSNFTEALQNYEQAFSYADIPWATDFHNACITSIYCRQFDKTFGYLDCLLQKGLGKEYFKENFDSLLGKQKKWKQFKRNLNTNIKSVRKTKRIDILEDLNKRVEKDQYYRKKMDNESEYRDSFYSTVMDNMRYLVQLEETFGMPDENLLGINELSELSFHPVIIVHFIQQQNFCKYDSSEIPIGYKRNLASFKVKCNYCTNNEIINFHLISMLRKNVQIGKFPILGLMNMYPWFMSGPNPIFYSKFSDEGRFEWVFSEEKDKLLMDYYSIIEKKSYSASGQLRNKFIFRWNKIEYPENFINRWNENNHRK